MPDSEINSKGNPSPETLHFTENISRYDWFSIVRQSPDPSDLKQFLRFKENEIIGNSHQKRDFIVACNFEGKPCNLREFKTFQHVSYGNCFSFNTVVDTRGDTKNPNTPKNISKIGSDTGLEFFLFFEKDEYFGVLGHHVGARLVIHNSDEYPPLLTKGIQVGAGMNTIISLHQENMRRENYPYSNCMEDWPEFLQLSLEYQKYRYTLEFCVYLCKQKALAETCGCCDTFDWRFTFNETTRNLAMVDCDVWNSSTYECITKVYQDFETGQRFCNCQNPCFETTHRLLISSAPWPSEDFAPYFILMMQNSNSSTVRKFLKSELSQLHLKAWNLDKLQDVVSSNFAKVEVHFETLVYVTVNESPKYTGTIILGTIGGNLGLWLGWSILTAFDTLQWAYKIVFISISKVNFPLRYKRRRAVVVNPE